jgi:hypothetical protein
VRPEDADACKHSSTGRKNLVERPVGPPGVPRIVREPELVAAVASRMDNKYGWSDGLIVEIRPAS